MIDIDKKIMESMKARDKVASDTFKMLKAKILEFKTAKNARPFDQIEEINLIKKMISDRENSAEIYLQNGRVDLHDEELAQAGVLKELLPPMPTKEDVTEYLNDTYPDGIQKKEMGRVIKEVKEILIGVDGKMLADLVKERLV